MRRVRDWVLTVPFLVVFGLTLAVFDLAGRLARPFGIRPFEYVMAALQRTLIGVFRICGTRLRVERSPDIRPRTGYVIIANHQSMLDIPLIGGLLFTNFPKYVAKRELGRWIPSISLNLRWGGNALIDRGDREQATAAIEAMARTAQERGVSVVIFPEGTRSRDGDLGTFRRGGVAALVSAADRLPVIPAVVDGSWKLLIHDLTPVPFGTRVRIRFGDPIGRRPGDGEEVVADAERWIRQTLAGWRSDPAA